MNSMKTIAYTRRLQQGQQSIAFQNNHTIVLEDDRQQFEHMHTSVWDKHRKDFRH